MRKFVLGGLMTAVLALAGCAGPEPPRVELIPECEPYRDNPTTFGRCQLYASGQGTDLIPEAGRTASLDAQIRCAHLRTSPEYYAGCIETVELEHASQVASAPKPDGSVAATADVDNGMAELLERVERLQEWRTIEPAAAPKVQGDTGEEANPAGL